MTEKAKILVADPISEVGIEALKSEPSFEVEVRPGLSEDELASAAADCAAIICRSGVKITAKVIDAAKSLRVVGRAGVGVDNIDQAAATRHGVVVMNTPGGNTISTAEHAFTLMMSLARKIPQAHASIVAGKWDRKSFKGTELNGKTLAVLGMGRIGSEFARRAIAFGMKVVAYDPYLSQSRAQLLRVELCDDLDDAVAGADFITLHMPSTPETKHMINRERIAKLKDGVRLINCARGGLIDEAALLEGLESGKIGGAALDVFESEPPAADYALLQRGDVVLTPHLGASTEEAQENVGIEIAEQIKNYLLHGAVINAVNTPSVDPKTLAQIGPYLGFGESLGRLLSQIAPARAEVLRVNYAGKVGEVDTTLISRSILKGYLEKPCGTEAVNTINAPSVAEGLGLRFTQSNLAGPSEFNDLVEVIAGAGGKEASVAGTFFGKHPRIVKINGRNIEADPSGYLLLLENTDMPGIVGRIGSVLGSHSVNIASLSLGRDEAGGRALAVFTLDSDPGEAVIDELEALDEIHKAALIAL